MKNELKNFPLESALEEAPTTVSIGNVGTKSKPEITLVIRQHVQEEHCIQLYKAQVVEIINLCRGRLIGNLTGLPIAFIGQVDQAMAYLRECTPTLDSIHQGGESEVIALLDAHPVESIQMIHAMALITRLLLADQAASPVP